MVPSADEVRMLPRLDINRYVTATAVDETAVAVTVKNKTARRIAVLKSALVWQWQWRRRCHCGCAFFCHKVVFLCQCKKILLYFFGFPKFLFLPKNRNNLGNRT